MTAVTYREDCGSPRGAAAHQSAGEGLCGWCAESEALARLRAEAVPSRPSAPGAELLVPVTAEQAQANQELLDAALSGVTWISDREAGPRTSRESECRDASVKAQKLRKAHLPIPLDVKVLAAEYEQSRRDTAARLRAGAA